MSNPGPSEPLALILAPVTIVKAAEPEDRVALPPIDSALVMLLELRKIPQVELTVAPLSKALRRQ